MIELGLRYWPTMNPIQNIDRAIVLYYLLEHLSTNTHHALLGHISSIYLPRNLTLWTHSHSFAAPLGLGPVGDVDIESAELHPQNQVPQSAKHEQFSVLFADIAVERNDLSFALNCAIVTVRHTHSAHLLPAVACSTVVQRDKYPLGSLQTYAAFALVAFADQKSLNLD